MKRPETEALLTRVNAMGHDSTAVAQGAERQGANDPELLAQVCTAAGWHAVPHRDGSVRIDLAIRGVMRCLMLREHGAGVRAEITLASDVVSRSSAECQAAANEFLVRSCKALRWVRAFVQRDGEQVAAAGFECFIAAPVEDVAVMLAIDALVAACEWLGRETEAIFEAPEVAALL